MTGPTTNVQGAIPARAIPAQKALADQQFSLADIDPIGRSEVLIYAPPGGGKTVLAATFPPPFRWLAADGKTCLKSVQWAWKQGLTSIKDPATDLIGFAPTEVMKDALVVDAVAFDHACDMIDHWFSPAEIVKWKGGTLVIDSGTTLDEWTLNKGLVQNSILPDPKKPLSRSHEINKKAMARIITGEQDYKSGMGLFYGFIQEVRVECAKHEVNLVLLCHEWTERSEEGNVISYRPLLTGQLRERISKDFDDIWYVEKLHGVRGPEFSVMAHGDPRHLGKSRWGTILDRTEPADFRQIIKKVKDFHGIK